MPTLVILGAGGHAKVVADAARLAGWIVAGFVDERRPERIGERFADAHLLSPQVLDNSDAEIAVAVAIGDCGARFAAARRLAARGFLLPAVVHPRAIVAASASIGPGCQLLAGAIINPEAKLGLAVLVNTAATVDHDCVIGDGVHLAPGVHLAGNVSVGDGSLVGIGTVVKPGVRIGRNCTIGAGSVVLHDVPDGATVYGVPARPRPDSRETAG